VKEIKNMQTVQQQTEKCHSPRAAAALLRASQAVQMFARKVEPNDQDAATQLYRASCWLKTVAVIL
jgi:hypothetical protein